MLRTLKKPELLAIYVLPLFTQLADAFSSTILILYALELNMDVLQINFMTSIASVITISLEVPFGILSDRLGRKPMLIFVRIFVALTTLIRVFSTQPIHLIIAAFFGGMGSIGDFYPILQSMIGDVAEPRERQEAMSTMFLFSGVGMLTAPIICTSLLLLPQITLRNIYQISFVAQVIIIIFIALKTHETRTKVIDTDTHPSQRHYVTTLVRQRAFQRLVTSSFLFWFSRSMINTYLQIYAKVNLHFSDAEVASFRIYSNLATMLIRFLSATVLTKVKSRTAFISFLVLGALSSLLAPFANTYGFILIIQFLSGISFGAIRILTSVLVTNISTPGNRGVANSVLQAFESTGSFTKIFTSPIVEIYGFTPLFILGGIMSLVAVIPQLPKQTPS